MSRLAKQAIVLPKGVEVKAAGEKLHVKGPMGALELKIVAGLKVETEGDQIYLSRDETVKEFDKAHHGLHWALLRNAVQGVAIGFEKKLTLIGVGYRAAVSGNKLDLQLGFSHPTLLEIPRGLQVTVDKGTAISIKGADRHEVGQFAAAVRAVRRPEPYKGKGVRYEDEYVRKKEGKAAKGK